MLRSLTAYQFTAVMALTRQGPGVRFCCRTVNSRARLSVLPVEIAATPALSARQPPASNADRRNAPLVRDANHRHLISATESACRG